MTSRDRHETFALALPLRNDARAGRRRRGTRRRGAAAPAWRDAQGAGRGAYAVAVLGDTHFDAAPASVYHSHYDESNRWAKVQHEEFARNGEMWKPGGRWWLVDPDGHLFFSLGCNY